MRRQCKLSDEVITFIDATEELAAEYNRNKDYTIKDTAVEAFAEKINIPVPALSKERDYNTTYVYEFAMILSQISERYRKSHDETDKANKNIRFINYTYFYTKNNSATVRDLVTSMRIGYEYLWAVFCYGDTNDAVDELFIDALENSPLEPTRNGYAPYMGEFAYQDGDVNILFGLMRDYKSIQNSRIKEVTNDEGKTKYRLLQRAGIPETPDFYDSEEEAKAVQENAAKKVCDKIRQINEESTK